MGFLKKVMRKDEEEEEPEIEGIGRYIDLATYKGSERAGTRKRGGIEVKVAEIEGYESLRPLSNFVYEGNILILDFTAIANDDLALRRIITELKRLVEDVGGDLAGISKNLLLVTPKNVAIDRHKIRRGFYY
jgi:SepF-like predicted cell division protein (DUF552 family)